MTSLQILCQQFDYSNKCKSTRGNQRTNFFDTYIPARAESLLKRIKMVFSGISAIHQILVISHKKRDKKWTMNL